MVGQNDGEIGEQRIWMDVCRALLMDRMTQSCNMRKLGECKEGFMHAQIDGGMMDK